ncbi:MAG: ribosome small subunit-dependent GTPase A [Chitinophagaceae bacterium]
MQGIVYKSTGNWYNIKLEDHTFIKARIKGIIKLDNDITATNPIAVGDVVHIEKVESDFLINNILDRKNAIVRKAIKKSKERHILTSNIDQIIILVSLKKPYTPPIFVDKILATATAYHISSTIIFNKIDLYEEKLFAKAIEYQKMYASLGYPSYLMSIEQKKEIACLTTIFKKKNSLLIGYSGVGKTSLLNILIPNKNFRTQTLNKEGEGKHTTTFVERHDLDFGGAVIDSPGIKKFDLIDIGEEELSHYFPEMLPFVNQCQYNNCTHIHEPYCKVIKAVENAIVYPQRYKNYISMMLEIQQDKKYKSKNL